MPKQGAFEKYRDAIALLRATIPYKATNPASYEAASAHCKETWEAWRREREANGDEQDD